MDQNISFILCTIIFLFVHEFKFLPIIQWLDYHMAGFGSADDTKLDAMLEVEDDAILEFQGRFHAWGVSEYITAVEMYDRQLDLLQRELLPDACPGSDSEGDVRIRVPLLLFVARRIKPLGPEQVGLREVLWVLGQDSRCQPNPCTLQSFHRYI